MLISRKTVIGEISIVPVGADSNTSLVVASSAYSPPLARQPIAASSSARSPASWDGPGDCLYGVASVLEKWSHSWLGGRFQDGQWNGEKRYETFHVEGCYDQAIAEINSGAQHVGIRYEHNPGEEIYRGPIALKIIGNSLCFRLCPISEDARRVIAIARRLPRNWGVSVSGNMKGNVLSDDKRRFMYVERGTIDEISICEQAADKETFFRVGEAPLLFAWGV
jgi:hypothetical protein